MTSLLRKKLQITVRNSLLSRTTSSTACPNRSHRHRFLQSFRDTLSSSTVILGSALFGLATTSASYAQQSTTWSPQPFAKPNVEATASQAPAIPANSLRQSEGQQSNEVFRWGIGNKSVRQTTPEKSYSLALTPDSSQSQITSHRIAIGTGSDTVQSTKSSEPRSGFNLESREPRSPLVLQDAKEPQQTSLVQHASFAENAPAPEKRTSGVWYDRNSAAESVATENVTTRKTNVQRAKFQEPPSANSLPFLPPGQAPSQTPNLPSPGDLMPVLPQSPKGLTLNEQVNRASEPQVQPSKPGRSLLEKDLQEIPPNPFPNSKSPKNDKDDLSPSDNAEPPQINRKRNDDPAPMPPRRKDRSSMDCDAIRAAAASTDIKSIRIDSSPSFVEGFKDKGRASQSSKESVVANAASRSWLSYDGQLVAEGKLSDLKLGSVIIEKADGTRTAFLLHKLSDADQVYVSEQWGLPVTCSIDDRSFPSRDFMESTVTWKASGACHKPLYFEDVQLERYGHELGPVVQPVISAARFFGDVVVLPYKMGINPLNECQYSLGYYRPGSCAPWSVGPVPISLRGALMQAKVVTGAALALP